MAGALRPAARRSQPQVVRPLSQAEAPGTLGKYRLLTKVGMGAMGEVWSAEDTGTVRRTVAIKLISTSEDAGPWLSQTLIDEARAMVSLPLHPNLVALHDVLEQDGLVALVMEFIEGHGLRNRLEGHPTGLPWSDIYPIAKGLLDGLIHAHAHGLIHRDLKPENIKLRPATLDAALTPEDVKILDFGLARFDPGHASTTGEVHGTIAYMSPEQITGATQGPTSDQYGLALILFELITGCRAFTVPSGRFEAHRNAHTSAPIPFLRPLREDVTTTLEVLIRKALAKAPSDRHLDLETLAKGLLPELAYLAQWRGGTWGSDDTDVGVPHLQGLGPQDAMIASPPPPFASCEFVTVVESEVAIPGPPDREDDFQVNQDEYQTRFSRLLPAAPMAPRASDTVNLLEHICALLMGEGSSADLLREALEGLCTQVEAAGGLMLVKDAEGNLNPLASWGSSAHGSIRFSRSLLKTVLHDRQALLLGATDFEGSFGEAPSIKARALTTALLAPLEHQDRIVGLLYLDGGPATRPFTPADLQLAVALAHLGAARLQRDLAEAQAKAKEKLEQEMAAARQIQTALLPESLPEPTGWEAHGSNETCLRVSGDAYGGWTSASGRIRYAIADVSGKGVGPGLLMASFMSWMEAHADSEMGSAELAGLISMGLGRRTSARHYLTAVLLDLDPRDGRTSITNAGHVFPLIIRANGNIEEVPSHGMPLAMLGGSSYGAFGTTLNPGDLLALVSDGLTEPENTEGDEFGLGRLGALLCEHRAIPLPLLDQLLRAEVGRFTAGAPRTDDQTIVLVRRAWLA